MSDLEILLKRNQAFASTYAGKQPIMPRFNTMVLTCVDARIDPAHFMKLNLGEALVFRNAGARVTADLELELGILWTMAQKMGGDRFQGFELAIVHHTDCGFERLANPELAGLLSKKLAVSPDQIAEMAVADHIGRIQTDIERLRHSSIVPDTLTVSGHIYDVDSGLIQQIIAPSRLEEQAD